MSLRELVISAYLLAEQHAWLILLASLGWAALGTLLAYLGKGGRSDRDGRAIANVVIGGAVLWAVVAVLAMALARFGFNKGPLDAHVMLLAAPIVCMIGSVYGIRWVFPLNELASVRTLRDVGAFLLACAVGLWLLSKFRGWGIWFLGSLADLLLVATLAVVLLRTLFRRAFPAAPRLK